MNIYSFVIAVARNCDLVSLYKATKEKKNYLKNKYHNCLIKTNKNCSQYCKKYGL